ncbi:hypothetical protein ABBQ32_003741 [Trebouxia sp. C0010 RCD-2024]
MVSAPRSSEAGTTRLTAPSRHVCRPAHHLGRRAVVRLPAPLHRSFRTELYSIFLRSSDGRLQYISDAEHRQARTAQHVLDVGAGQASPAVHQVAPHEHTHIVPLWPARHQYITMTQVTYKVWTVLDAASKGKEQSSASGPVQHTTRPAKFP